MLTALLFKFFTNVASQFQLMRFFLNDQNNQQNMNSVGFGRVNEIA